MRSAYGIAGGPEQMSARTAKVPMPPTVQIVLRWIAILTEKPLGIQPWMPKGLREMEFSLVE